MKSELDVPFVVRQRTPLPACASAAPEHHYDPVQQLWISLDSGEPLVLRRIRDAHSRLVASEFGETIVTRTVEGTDQSEGRIDHDCGASLSTALPALSASQFGETTLTETGEGIDQSERTTSA